MPVGALRRQRARRLRHLPRLGRAGLGHPAGNLNRIDAVATQHDVRAVLYPRVGTMIERGDERYGGARGCLGSPRCPCAWTPSPAHRRHRPRRTDLASPGRIAHPHEGRRPRPGPPGAVRARTYTEAVGDGMYRPLGRGDVDVTAIVGHLRKQGYGGWCVLEQDTILTEEPPHRGTQRRGPSGRRAHQRRVPAKRDQ